MLVALKMFLAVAILEQAMLFAHALLPEPQRGRPLTGGEVVVL
jgi:hypothetical protein